MLDITFKILLYAPPLLLAVILHEIAHGAVAYRLGDPTAWQRGRLTLNPVKHIDPFMPILLPVLLIMAKSPVVFGGAKPVPINPMYFDNPRRGMMWVAFAGPFTNICLAVISVMLYNNYGPTLIQAGGLPLSMLLGVLQAGNHEMTLMHLRALLPSILLAWILISIFINVVLALFNLFPILPLDGGRILAGFLPAKLSRAMHKLERYGLLIIFLLLYLGVFNAVFTPVFHYMEGMLR